MNKYHTLIIILSKHIIFAFILSSFALFSQDYLWPLKAGQNIRISTPFFVKIPDAKFSRLGHVDQSYMITQWYPKPAVYDKDGWHEMPYLDQGEFYSEFGRFEVLETQMNF